MPVPQTPADRALAQLLTSVTPALWQQLQSPTWRGFEIAEPALPAVRRKRLVHTARLRVTATRREYAVSAHLFDAVGQETLPHDHRYPLAVLPFALDDASAGPLYLMAWTDVASGGTVEVEVNDGDVWAIADARSVRHTVRSLRPHGSLLIADVTDEPTRDDRMRAAPLPPDEITRVRGRLLGALTDHLDGKVDAGGVAGVAFAGRRGGCSDAPD